MEHGRDWVMVVAGEASGDQHAAGVVAELKRKDPSLRFFGMGGPRLAAEGVELIHGSHEISVIGLVEVLPKLRRIWQVLFELVEAAKARRPVAALLVDVPDFNLRLAKRLKPLGIPIAWYVAPMAWAWRESRVNQLRARVDHLLCILPFEEKFFRDRGVRATFVGNPVLEQLPAPKSVEEHRRALGLELARPTLALLPGSRKSELSRLLPTLVELAQQQLRITPGLQIVVPIAAGLSKALVEEPFRAAGLSPILIDGRAPEVVGACDVAVVASGTATLEAALIRRPMVVIYRLSPLTYLIGRALVRLPWFSLVNLLAERGVVPELLQDDVTAERITRELEPLWHGPQREALLAGLDEVRAKLGELGAGGRAADAVLALISRRY